MTSNVPAAFDCADHSSDGVTNAVTPSAVAGPADAPMGPSTASASVASSAVRRLPLPHRALEREPAPRLPLPQSALARTPRRSSPFRIPLPLSPQLTGRNVESRTLGFVTLPGYERESSP